MATKNNNTEYAVEYRKGSKWNQNPDRIYKYMECKVCGQFTPVGEDATAVTCPDCVAEMMPAMQLTRRQKSDKPRGWQWMAEYVHTDVKGTLEPTDIVAKPKLTKQQKVKLKSDASLALSKLKKEFGKATSIRVRKKIRAEINRQSKIAQGKFSKKVVKDFLDSI